MWVFHLAGAKVVARRPKQVRVSRSESARVIDSRILDDLPTIAYATDADGHLRFLSAEFYRQTGAAPDVPLGVAWLEAMHPEDRERVPTGWKAAVGLGQPYEDELRLRLADDTYRWYICRAAPVREETGELTGYVGSAFDIHGQKKAEAELRELIKAHEAVSARERLYARFGEQLSGALALDETVDVMLRAIVPAFADWMSVYLAERDGSGYRVIGMRHWDQARQPIVEELMGTSFATEGSATAQVLRTGQSLLLSRYPEELRARSIRPEYQAQLRQLGLRSAIVVPFRYEETIIGAIHVIRGDTPVDFGPDDLLLIEEMARRMTPALHNAEMYERERLVARRFQEAALPTTLPQIDGFTFDSVYQPAERVAQIGGDWYDAFQLDDGRVVLSIGDVAGHGLDAAVTMSSVRQSLRAAAVIDPAPLGLLRAGDRIVRAIGPDSLVTAFVGLLDPVSLELTFASAGHPPPLIRHADRSVATLGLGGMPLGIYESAGRVVSGTRLEPGSIVALYTDGLTEFDRNVIRGEARVAEALRQSDDDRTAHFIYHSIARGRPPRDDVAILTLRFDK